MADSILLVISFTVVFIIVWSVGLLNNYILNHPEIKTIKEYYIYITDDKKSLKKYTFVSLILSLLYTILLLALSLMTGK